MTDPLHAVTDQLHSVADRLPTVADRLPSMSDQWHTVTDHLPSAVVPDRFRPTPTPSRRPNLWLLLLGAGIAGAFVFAILRSRRAGGDTSDGFSAGIDASRNGGLSSVTPATAAR